MNMRIRRYALVVAAGILLTAVVGNAAVTSKAAKAKAAIAAKADKNRKLAVWEKAGEVYKTALNVYRLGDWKKGSKAMEGFVRRYPTNENVPLAYLQLADCQFRTKNAEGGEKTLDVVIKKFPASKVAFYAYGYKLHRLLNQSKYDDFFKTYQAMIKKMGQAPMSLSPRLDWRRQGDYYWRFNNVTVTWPYKRRVGYSLQFAPSKLDWAQDLLRAGNTPQRAGKMLRILDGTLRKKGKDLPVQWKFAHILLLRKAGRGRSADAQYKKYLRDWPKGDPRRMGLMLYEAQWAQAQPASPKPKPVKASTKPAAKKDIPVDYQKRADDIYASLIKEFPGWTTLGDRLPSRIRYLYKRRRHDEFLKLARWFLDKYPASGWRNGCVSLWVKLARQRASSGDTSQVPVALKLLEEEARAYSLNPQAMRANLVKRIGLYIALKQSDKALKTARSLVARKLWSAETFDQLITLAGRYKALKDVEAEARAKYGIPALNPSSKALPLLGRLKKRIAQNKVRHMEEIGKEMFEKYHKDAYTIEAVKLLVEYFFKKALHEQRDKWSSLMVKAYKYHPLTQAVMTFQINAEHGARNFSRLAGLTTTAMNSFPSAGAWNTWFNYRVKCFQSVKDPKGGAAFVKKCLDARASAGEIFAIGRIGYAETDLQGLGTQKGKGDYWMRRAKKWAGKHQEVYCIKRAFNAYYLLPCRYWWWKRVDFPGAARAARAMQRQTLSPELRWKTQFDDINMMAQGGFGKDVAKALAKRLKTNKLSFHLSELLDLANLGTAIGKHKVSAAASGSLSQIKGRCKKSQLDNREFSILRANMFRNEGRALQAGGAFLQAAKYYSWPIDRWVLEVNAINSLRGTKKYVPVISKYAASIKSAQDMVPRLLLWAGNSYASKTQTRKQAMNFLMKLQKLYPASSQRGALEGKVK